MDSETPFEDPAPGDGNDTPYQWLDEWLCEYVDGTMDPSLEAVFEQYVEANPELKAHIERLQKTRDLLCECSLSGPPAPDGEPGPNSVPDPPAPPPSPPPDRTRPTVMIGMVSSIAVALVVGFLAGATMVSPSALSWSGGPSPSVVQTEAEPPPTWQRAQIPARAERPRPDRAAPFSPVDSTDRSSSLIQIARP